MLDLVKSKRIFSDKHVEKLGKNTSLNVEIKNNKSVMKDSGLSCSAKNLPEYLKVKK